MAAFATAFEPVWATAAGDLRGQALCAARRRLLGLAGAIDKDAPPAGKGGQDWREDVEALQIELEELQILCDEGDLEAADEAAVDTRKHLDRLAS